MYPQGELIGLAAHKAALRRRIALRREQWVEAGAVVVQPLVWLDRVRELTRKLSPWIALGAVPLGFVLRRTLFPRLKMLGSVLRWSPVVISVIRGLASKPGGETSRTPAFRPGRASADRTTPPKPAGQTDG